MGGRRKQLSTAQGILLIHPPIYDIKFHWPKWQVPTALLSLGAELRAQGHDVRLLDTIFDPSGRVQRSLTDYVLTEESQIQKWRYGLPAPEFLRRLVQMGKEGWIPDTVIIEGFTTFWWEGVQEACLLARTAFPDAKIHVTGAYAEFAPRHVKSNTCADAIRKRQSPLIHRFPLLDLYGTAKPKNLGLNFPRTVDEVDDFVDQVINARSIGTSALAFHFDVDQDTAVALDRFRTKLQSRKAVLSFDVLGTIAPNEVIEQPEIANLLRSCGMKHIWMSDDRDVPQTESEQFIDDCRRATELFHIAGYRPRTDSVNAGLCIGRLGDDLAERTRAATLLSHHVGSVVLWPYQPKPAELPRIPLEKQNGKLFPLRRSNGLAYSDYAELVALNAVLNSRYRDCSFDFLGDGLVAKLLAGSIAREAWNADQSVKGPLTLPMRPS